MRETAKAYEQLTSVNIDEQKRLWDERGKGYYGEWLLFEQLYDFTAGNCKILMNLNIPVDNGKTTEIDLLLIHETGIYVFEVKYYKGTIYGTDTQKNWTQYFRTATNSHFKNPVLQNQYHIAALKKIFPKIPIYSFVVFTNYQCSLRVENKNPDIDICTLSNMKNQMNSRIQKAEKIYNIDEIDYIFNELARYSPMQDEIIYNGEEPAPFYSWLQPFIDKYEKEKENLILKQNILEKEKKTFIKFSKSAIIFALLFALVCTAFSAFVVKEIKANEKQATAEFRQKFLHIDEIDNQFINSLSTYFTVSNRELKPLTADAVQFSVRIGIATETYGMVLQKNAKYIVMKKDGSLYEYDMFGESNQWRPYSTTIGRGHFEYRDLTPIQFYGISNTNEIDYIKITGIQLIKTGIPETDIKDNLELELYKAQ